MKQTENLMNQFWQLPALLFAFCFVFISCKEPTNNQRETQIVSNEVLKKSDNAHLPLNDSIVAYGMQYLGTPYVAAGCSEEGFDCSGFVYYVFKHFKIDVPRSSSGFANFGEEIPISDVQKGDILVFLSPTRNEIGHIGIVSKANGKSSDFLHATSGRAMSVVTTSLTDKGYTNRFVKAVRVLVN